MHSIATIHNNIVLFVKRPDLNYSHHKNKWSLLQYLRELLAMVLAMITMAIILHTYASNQHVIHLKLPQCYVSNIFLFLNDLEMVPCPERLRSRTIWRGHCWCPVVGREVHWGCTGKSPSGVLGEVPREGATCCWPQSTKELARRWDARNQGLFLFRIPPGPSTEEAY